MSGLRCQAKRGVMTLRTCGEPATVTCSKCQRLTCPQHCSPAAVMVCLQCAAEATKPSATVAPLDYDQPGWSYGMRNWIIVSGGAHDSVGYDATDLRSFEQRRDDDFTEESTAGGSFTDS